MEYASKAVENSGTAIGLRVKDGIVLAVEKLVLSKLLVPGANKRIASVDHHAGIVSHDLARCSQSAFSMTTSRGRASFRTNRWDSRRSLGYDVPTLNEISSIDERYELELTESHCISPVGYCRIAG